VTNFARSLAHAGSVSHRLRILALAAMLAGFATLALAPAARAQVVSIGAVPVGMQAPFGETPETEPHNYANPSGNPVLHGYNTYAIYWDPTDNYHGDWQGLIDRYLANDGAASGSFASVNSIDTQYTDKTNVPAYYSNSFHGAYTDTKAYPANGCEDPAPMAFIDRIGFGNTTVCLTSTQMAAELQSFITSHGLPTGMGTVYYLLTPPAVTVCLDGGGASGHCSAKSEIATEVYEHSFCSYHADINPGGLATGDGNTIVYGVIPWVAGGRGDGHLTGADQTPGWECQDGGFDPSSKPPGEFEKPHEHNKAEEEAFEKMDKKEKEEAEKKEKEEGPHQQEPNQVGCPTADGTCDFGLADLIISQLGLEQQNIVTDPLLNGWQDSFKSENTDECRFWFAPIDGGSVTANEETHAGTLSNQKLNGSEYYINSGFNLAAYRLPYPGIPCPMGIRLEPEFTAPNPVNAGEVVGFDGMESDITLGGAVDYPSGGGTGRNYATYSWNFGDGTSAVGYAPGAPACEITWLNPCAASEYHTYTYGGTYNVTLKVTDVGGNVRSVNREITVLGPPAPTGGSSGGPGSPGVQGSTPSSGSGAGGSGSGKGSTPPPGKPVISAGLMSRSLSSALRKGLAIGYSVNEQVAGHFEVLISRSVARKLKITGTPATGLPPGTAPQLVIAKAFLVTTKGGRSVVHVKFSKATAARLRHAHSVTLMLRLIVHNAASTNPQSTTFISSAKLAG
jgi:hypothetical protein